MNLDIRNESLKYIHLKCLKKVKDSHLKSFLLPTSTMGTLGQKCFTSGTHFSGIFCNESGESIEKHINITSVSGYDSGRSRS